MGGQGLPSSIGIAINEMLTTANWAWAMYPGLSEGAVATLEASGTISRSRITLTKLISGVWSGTMCLTEPHCGTDLGQMKTKATPNEDGSYSVNGTKIFISAGEHDLTENIVHIVLAKLPDAPAGTKGLSLFIIPKFSPLQMVLRASAMAFAVALSNTKWVFTATPRQFLTLMMPKAF